MNDMVRASSVDPATLWARPMLAAALASLALAACTVVLAESGSPSAERKHFQQLVGGLGFGASLDASRCCFSFDPRIEAACGNDVWPVPAGRGCCHVHAWSVFSYPEVPSAQRANDTAILHAPTH